MKKFTLKDIDALYAVAQRKGVTDSPPARDRGANIKKLHKALGKHATLKDGVLTVGKHSIHQTRYGFDNAKGTVDDCGVYAALLYLFNVRKPKPVRTTKDDVGRFCKVLWNDSGIEDSILLEGKIVLSLRTLQVEHPEPSQILALGKFAVPKY